VDYLALIDRSKLHYKRSDVTPIFAAPAAFAALVGDLVAPFRDAGVQRVVGQADLHSVLPSADAVVLACALTPETQGLMSSRELALMKPDAWLVNVGRGRLIVTDHLVDALRERRIGGATLDVTDPEPLPKDHPLWTLDNCLITPHIGNTRAMAVPLLSERITTNCRLFASGEPLVGLVDVALGYWHD